MSKPVMATTPPKASAQPGQDLPAVPDPAEELEHGDPARLQADQRSSGRHRGQLQRGDEAGEVQCQRDGGRQGPAELACGDPAELAGLAHQHGPAITAAPIALRQKAMARALTEVAPRVAAIRGPEEATPSTPRAARKKFTLQQ